MEVCPGAAAEGGAAVLIEDDYIDLFDVPVGEPSFLLPLCPHVLAHDQIRRIAGDPFRREGVSLLLHLHVVQGAVLSLCQKIHDQVAFPLYQPILFRKHV